MGGWLHQAPRKDRANDEDDRARNGRSKRLLQVRAVGHKMAREEETVPKQQRDRDVILCMDCFNRRKLGAWARFKRASRRQSQLSWDQPVTLDSCSARLFVIRSFWREQDAEAIVAMDLWQGHLESLQ